MAKKSKKKSPENAENAAENGGEVAVAAAKAPKVKKVKKKKEVDPIIFPIFIVIAIIGMLLAKIVYETWKFSQETAGSNKNTSAVSYVIPDDSDDDGESGSDLNSDTYGENSFAYLNLDGKNYDVV